MTDSPRKHPLITIDAKKLPDYFGRTEASIIESKRLCRERLVSISEWIRHRARRVTEQRMSPDKVSILVAFVDDLRGGEIAETLLPGHDWDAYRRRKQVPYAGVIAPRSGVATLLSAIDMAAALKFQDMPGLTIVIVDYGVADVFSMADLRS